MSDARAVDANNDFLFGLRHPDGPLADGDRDRAAGPGRDRIVGASRTRVEVLDAVARRNPEASPDGGGRSRRLRGLFTVEGGA